MTNGVEAYNALVVAQAAAEDLLHKARSAGMDHKDTELIRNYVSGLKSICESWKQERSRWDPPVQHATEMAERAS